MSYDERHDIVSALYLDGEVHEVDALGSNPRWRPARRVETMVSEIFWMIWSEFFPETDVDRESRS